MKIKNIKLVIVAVMLAIATPAFAQLNKAKLLKSAGKAAQAMTITDEQLPA